AAGRVGRLGHRGTHSGADRGGAGLRRPFGGGSGGRARAVPGRRLPRMGLRPRLAGNRPGRESEKTLRQIGGAARMNYISSDGERRMAAPLQSLKELFLAALEVAPADRAAWL